MTEAKNQSLWQDNIQFPETHGLRQDLNVDVCVVGAGISGLLTAYALIKEGKRVCVLESFELGGGQTGRTSAHLSNVLDDGCVRLEQLFGKNGALLAIESHGAALDKIEKIARQEKISCDLERVPGYLFAENLQDGDKLKSEWDAFKRVGAFELDRYEQAKFLDGSGISSFRTSASIRIPDQLQFHPLKFIAGLANAILKAGGRIYTNSHVTDVRSGSTVVITTKFEHRVFCSSAVIATNTPINDLFAIHTKQAPYRSYVLAYEIPKGSVVKGLYWDMEEPYHYVRVQEREDYDILIVGGEDHKTGQKDHPEECFLRLSLWTEDRFPFVKDEMYRWSGQVMEPVDGLGYLGHNPMDRDNVYIITGDSGHGLTHGALGAMIISDQIMGRNNPWEKLYSPSRISLRATSDFIKENANVAAQYGDWLQPRPKPNLHLLGCGEGVVYREGVKMIAAYKDDHGNLKFMSASCPHLAGVVRWNSVEKSWDCPCHGSRFDCKGRVIEGPASTDLQDILSEPDQISAPADSVLGFDGPVVV